MIVERSTQNPLREKIRTRCSTHGHDWLLSNCRARTENGRPRDKTGRRSPPGPKKVNPLTLGLTLGVDQFAAHLVGAFFG